MLRVAEKGVGTLKEEKLQAMAVGVHRTKKKGQDEAEEKSRKQIISNSIGPA